MLMLASVSQPAGNASSMSPLFRIWEMLAIVFLGVLGGVLGALLVICNGYGLARWRKVGGAFSHPASVCWQLFVWSETHDVTCAL
jgi:hypothetical protein